MASFVAIDWSDEKHNEHGSGTDTTMDKYDEQTCICMWGELAEKESLQSFGDLITLWYRNLEEYATTGTAPADELPFAVQFLSPGWFPKLTADELKTLREYFCAIDPTQPDTKKREIVLRLEPLPPLAPFAFCSRSDSSQGPPHPTQQTHARAQYVYSYTHVVPLSYFPRAQTSAG